MDELKQLSNSKNVLQISKTLQKIAKRLEQQKKDQGKIEPTFTELNLLKEQCLSKNIQLSLLSCQTLFGLIENDIIEPANGLTMFITMLSGASSAEHLMAIGEGIINILLLDLKIAAIKSKSKNVSYVCPFGLKTAQHPIITLLQKKNVNVIDLACRINGILKHSDELIRLNSLEFLRPVYSFVFCNPNKISDSTMLWTGLLEQRSNDANYLKLLYDLFRWNRITHETCQLIAIHLVNVIDTSLNETDSNMAIEFGIYLFAMIPALIEFGNDPRMYFDALIRVIQSKKEMYIDTDLLDYNLISISQIIQIIPPFYLEDALHVVKILLETSKTKNYIILNMILDVLILRLAINGRNIPAKVLIELNRLIKVLSKQTFDYTPSKPVDISNEVLYFHSTAAYNWNLVQTSSKLCDELSKNNLKSLNQLMTVIESHQTFSIDFHSFLRAVLLSEKINFDLWLRILKQILKNAKSNPDISSDTIYYVLYVLAKESDGLRQLELLRGLTTFASVKENIPLLMNTYRSLSTSFSVSLRCLAIDLHTRLWQVESRTYQFLQDILLTEEASLSKIDQWEMNISKANAIKVICSTNASQYGTDLVAPLSKILNNSIDNDLARALSLDAVILLCKSHTVNIASTWKVLRNVFNVKLDARTTKSLCNFFGEVPLLKSPTNEYEQLYNEALERLWSFVMNSDQKEIIQHALIALKNFDFTELTLKHIPTLFYEEIHIPKEFQKQIEDSKSNPDAVELTVVDVVPYIPGECWIEFLKKINQNAVEDAIEFVVHLIESEMLQYKSGVYMLPEGRPEPNDMKQLHARSPLRAIVKYIREQSDWNTEATLAVRCLQCIGNKYSRPMPPLNWFFLIEYINHGTKFSDSDASERFEMKMQALRIASNQTAHSGSARNIIENYLQQFDTNTKDMEEILLIVKLVPNICFGVVPRILASFLRNILDFLYQHSASTKFEENSHFEQSIQSLTELFELKCPAMENVDIVVDKLCRFNDIIDSDTKIYDRYVDCLLKLPSECYDRLSSPSDWNIRNFRKALILRKKAILSKKALPNETNPWMWIDLLIDNVWDAGDAIADSERKEILLTNIFDLLLKNLDDGSLRDWIVYFLGKVQSNFTVDVTNQRIDHSLFCLDLFIYCLVLCSGCYVFLNNEIGQKNRLQWLNKLPEALWLLTKQKSWRDHMPRIFEFLYHLNTQQTNLPMEYVTIACNTLVCVKNHEYFLQKSTWTKFFSLKAR